MVKPVWLFISLTFIFANSSVLFANEYQRKATVEWEPIEGAKSYDLELSSSLLKSTKPKIVKTTHPEWTGIVRPGTYSMRIRARDSRNVPGDWSEAQELKINLENAKLLSPKSQEVLRTDEQKEAEINLNWAPIGGADEYVVEVNSTDGINITKTVSENKITLSLPVAKKYTWKVIGQNSNLKSDAASTDEFSVSGKKLLTPAIEKPENEFVREIKWSTPEGGENFDYTLARLNSKDKKWEVIERQNDVKSNVINFKPEWPGGRYRLTVNAKAVLRDISDKSEIRFGVVEGNRSPSVEYTQTLRQSIDRTSGYFGIASYLITMMDYKGDIRDAAGSVKFSSLGGTGRVGLGYLSPASDWGFLGIADYSGFYVDNKIYNFASLEMNAVYRKNDSSTGESRHQLGLFYKELPEIRGNGIGSYTGTETLASVGPHYGYEYWRAISPKLGLQFNIHSYLSLLKVKTTNGENILPSLSYQLGLLGSYRFQKDMTGLLGYAYRNDVLSYKTVNPLLLEDKNSVRVQGHYLNLFLEWAI